MRSERIAVACLLLATAAGARAGDVEAARTREAAAGLDWSRLAGWYRGTVSDGLNDLLAGARFGVGDDGRLRGSYFFYEGGTPQPGHLEECRMTAPDALACRWHDTYGEGTFEARFAEDLGRFDGHWGDDGESPWLPWFGVRVQCSAAQQAARLVDVEPTREGIDETCTLD
jgi:hypothetical protein